jgi:DNA primase
MSSEGTCDSLYRPDVRMVAVFDLDADAIVLFVERFHIALDIGEELVEPIFVTWNLLA